MAREDSTACRLRQFWAAQADELLLWSRPWEQVLAGDFSTAAPVWFAGGQLNAAVNCLDRHLAGGRRNKAALIWQGEREEAVRVYTYQLLLSEVCRLANVLKKKGVGKGDCVAIYLPMVPELVVAMLACARIGALHTVVFSGFSSSSLLSRLEGCQAKVLITADGGIRAGRTIPSSPMPMRLWRNTGRFGAASWFAEPIRKLPCGRDGTAGTTPNSTPQISPASAPPK
jgi:acetyl-CoA synthetase